MVWIDYASSFDKICEGGKHKTHLCIPLRQGTARDWRGVPKFIDEPTLGLDVLARSDLWDAIRTLKGSVTIILTTHYMEEAEALSDRIGIMKNGRLLALGTAGELKKAAGTEKFEDAFIKIVKEGTK